MATICSTRDERYVAMGMMNSMRVASKPALRQILRQMMGRGLVALALFLALSLGATIVLSGAPAHAENLDQGKSGPRLFADSCVTCHRSARGLAKGRFSLTLYMFLQQHYVSNSSAAKELTSYLESVDSAAPDRRSGPPHQSHRRVRPRRCRRVRA